MMLCRASPAGLEDVGVGDNCDWLSKVYINVQDEGVPDEEL